MDFLKSNFHNVVLNRFGQSIQSLERAFNHFGLDYYLIGAFVRDLWTNHIATIQSPRATYDLDFAVLINTRNEFEQLVEFLVVNENFTRHTEPYRLIASNGSIIDIIPFGATENEVSIAVGGKRLVYLSVFGTREVTNHAAVVEGNFKVISLPGFCILKLISWSENPGRAKDLEDFYFVLNNYSEIFTDELYLPVNLELVEQCAEFRFAGARLLGRQMAEITQKSEQLNTRISELLMGMLSGFTQAEVDEMYEANNDNLSLVMKLVSELLDEYHKS